MVAGGGRAYTGGAGVRRTAAAVRGGGERSGGDEVGGGRTCQHEQAQEGAFASPSRPALALPWLVDVRLTHAELEP